MNFFYFVNSDSWSLVWSVILNDTLYVVMVLPVRHSTRTNWWCVVSCLLC